MRTKRASPYGEYPPCHTLLERSARHIEIAGDLGEISIKSRYKTAGDDMGKPALPHGVSGKPQSVEGARRNTPPTAFCFES
jgi:hypothetical protein